MGCFDDVDGSAMKIAHALDTGVTSENAENLIHQCLTDFDKRYSATQADWQKLMHNVQQYDEPGVGFDLDFEMKPNLLPNTYILRHAGKPKLERPKLE